MFTSIHATLMLIWLLVMVVLEITSYTPRFSSSSSSILLFARRRNLAIRMLGGNNEDHFPIDGNAANSSALSFFGPNRNVLFKTSEEMNSDINDDEQLTISKGFIPSGPLDLTTVDKQQKVIRSRDPKAIKYFEIVEQLAPNEMLQKFATTAPQHVQAAAKSTILSILGSLPSYALDANVITTSSKLANLLYQMQMTGYMFKNAEYRMSLARSLKGLPRLPAPAAVNQGNITFNPSRQAGEVIGMSGEVQVRTITGDVVTVDVNELTGALSQEVESLRSALALIRDERESELRSNLLTYIQALPERDLAKLTSDMSAEIIDSIQMLVDALMERLGIDTTGPEVVIQQNVGAMAQLCMWQMVMGYKLRELEAMDKGVTIE